MPLVTSAKTVTTNATLLGSPTHGSTTDPMPIQVFNNAASAVVYIGGVAVTTATGIPVIAQAHEHRHVHCPLAAHEHRSHRRLS